MACDNPNEKTKETSFHGHSMDLLVTFKNSIHVESGLSLDRDFADKVIQDKIIRKYDRRNLNNILEIPTGENLIQSIHNDLQSTDLNSIYFQCQLKETNKNTFSSEVNKTP